MMEDVCGNVFDAAILISIDGDFVPLLRKIRGEYLKIARLGIVQNKISTRKDLIRKNKIYGEENIIVISRALLEQCQLPDVIPVDEDQEIHRPKKYRRLSPTVAS